MSAHRGDGRAQIKRIILVAFIAIIATVEFGLYPFSSSVDFRIRAPASAPTASPTAHAGSARERESARSIRTYFLTDSASSTTGVEFGEAFGYSWAVDSRALSDGVTMVNVRAKKVGPIGLVSTRMFAYSVNTRTGVAAQSLMTRISMGCGKELPAHTSAEQSLMSLTLPTQTLAKMPGAVGKKGTIDLVIRVKVWNNPFHVVFKDELYDLLTSIAGASFAFVCMWRVLTEVREERERRRAARKMRFVRHEILHKNTTEDVDQGGWLRLAYSLSGVPLSTVLDMIRIPLWALNIVADALADIIVETSSLCWIILYLLIPMKDSPSTAGESPYGVGEGHREEPEKSHRKTKQKHTPPPRIVTHRRREQQSDSRDHERRDSVDISLRRLVVAQEDIDAERMRAAKEETEAREHAEAQIRAKMKRERIATTRLRDRRGFALRSNDHFTGDSFSNKTSFGGGGSEKPPSGPLADTHGRQESLELHSRQRSLIHHMLHEIDDLDLPEDSKNTVPIEEPQSPKVVLTKSPSFSRMWDAPTL